MNNILKIATALINCLYKDYDSDGAAISTNDFIAALRENGLTDVSFDGMLNAQKEANTIYGKEIIVYNSRIPFFKGFELKNGHDRNDLRNLYYQLDEKEWQVTQNIFFSMMSDTNPPNYYDINKGEVVTYMEQYLVLLS